MSTAATATNNSLPADAYDEDRRRMMAVWSPNHQLNAIAGGSTPSTTPAVASSEDDNNSLSTEAMLAALEEEDNTPGPLELFVNNDALVDPKVRVSYLLMCARVQGINIDEIYASVLDRPGMKSKVKPSKDNLVKEVKRRDSEKKVNKKNKSVQDLLGMLKPLSRRDYPKDVSYIIAKEKEIRETLLTTAVQADAEASTSARQTIIDWLRFCLILATVPEVLSLYRLSHTPATREQLDAGETPASLFHQAMVTAHNDASIVVSTKPSPTLHSDFADAIICRKGDFKLTPEKSKKNLNDIRRNLTSLISKWELSGNGANQRDDSADDVIDEDGLSDNWGRFDRERARQYALENGDTNDGDDRANFLQHLPTFWLMIWEIFDEHDLLRFTCAQLREEHSASSDSTPAPAARGSKRGSSSSRTRKLEKIAEDTLELQKTLVETVGEFSKAFESLAGNDISNEVYERSNKVRRLDKLSGERYLVYRESLSSGLNDDEKVAAKERVRELDALIAQLKDDIDASA